MAMIRNGTAGGGVVLFSSKDRNHSQSLTKPARRQVKNIRYIPSHLGEPKKFLNQLSFVELILGARAHQTANHIKALLCLERSLLPTNQINCKLIDQMSIQNSNDIARARAFSEGSGL